MPTADPISDAEKRWIYRLHEQGLARNQIARETGISPASVSRLCADAGLAFDRAQIKAATAARKADLADRRARVVERLYGQQETLLGLLEAAQQGVRPWDTVLGAGGGEEKPQQLQFVPAVDLRAVSHSISSFVASAAKLESVDSGDKAEAAKSMLGDLMDRMKVGVPTDPPDAGLVSLDGPAPVPVAATLEEQPAKDFDG